MLPIHTILHPTDFSEHSQFAWRLACALARDYGARLVVVHVIDLPVAVYGEGVMVSEPEDYQAVEEELDRMHAPDPNVRVEHRVLEGDPVEEILVAARQAHAELIVMGTHGRTGLERLLMGSVAEQVVRRSTCPVLTVRTPFPEAAPAGELAAAAAHA